MHKELIILETLPENYHIISYLSSGKEKCCYLIFNTLDNKEYALLLSYYTDFSMLYINSSKMLKLHNIKNLAFSHYIDYFAVKHLPEEIENHIILYDEECENKIYFAFTMELLIPLNLKTKNLDINNWEEMCEEALMKYEEANNKFGWIHGDWDVSNIMLKRVETPRFYNGKIFDSKYILVFIDYFVCSEQWKNVCDQENKINDEFDKGMLKMNLSEILEDYAIQNL